MNKNLILTALFIVAICIALPAMGMAAPANDKGDRIQQQDQLKDQIDQESDSLQTQDQIKDKLQDGSCQTTDPLEPLKEAGAL